MYKVLLVLIGELPEMLDEIRDLALAVAPQVHLIRGLVRKNEQIIGARTDAEKKKVNSHVRRQ